jgi:hypothetical protein
MKKTTLALGGLMMAAALSLTACGTNEGELAKEFCGLLKDQTDAAASGDTKKVEDANKALTDWIDENEDKKGDPDEFEDAVKDECGDIANLP